MKINSLLLVVFIALNSCKSGINIEEQFDQLKDNQTKCIVKVNRTPFFEANEAIFDGSVSVTNDLFKMNEKNLTEGNFILTIQEADWYKKKNISAISSGKFSTFMIGKKIDSTKYEGYGYLMTEGLVEPLTISREKIVIKIKGLVKKYPKLSDNDPAYDLEGYVIAKKPFFDEYSIPE